MSSEILILGLNPAWQRLFYVENFKVGEVHRIKKVEEYSAGKGINCGLVLKILGASPLMMHFLGSEHGSRIFDEISTRGIQQAPIWIKEPTRICTTVVSNGESTELIEPSPILSENENEDFVQTMGDYWGSIQRVALCGTFPKGLNEGCLDALDFTGKKIYIDAVDGIDKWLEKGPELLKINFQEYCKLLSNLGIPLVTSSPQFWKMSATAVLERYSIKTLVVTDEAAPVKAFRLVEKKFQGVQITPPTVQVNNRIGAGDAFFAGFLYADGENLDLEKCLIKATAVASARCEVDRPCNIKASRIAELEAVLTDAVEKLE